MNSILVVDDDQNTRSMLGALLTLEGYHVHLAEHGGPALDLLRATPEPLLVLLGLMMPIVDGKAVLEALAADPALAARHRVIVVTAGVKSATQGRIAALRAQLDAPLVAKPFEVDELLSVVARKMAKLTP